MLHIAVGRDDELWFTDRSEIAGVDASLGIRGGRLRLTLPSAQVTLDRIRPRGYAAELAALLTPIQSAADDAGSPPPAPPSPQLG